MNPNEKRVVRTVLQAALVAMPLLLAMPRPSVAAEAGPTSCRATTYRTVLDARLAAKADEGIVSLRRFVQRTRTVYQMDIGDALAAVARHRDGIARCQSDMNDE